MQQLHPFGHKPVILVVDDSPNNLELMATTLANYTVKVAKDGEKALTIARNISPDLILLDIMMPGMDGYEVCRRLKDDSKTRDIPVIFLTALSEAESEKHGLELGAVDYITKPFSSPIVVERVKNHLLLKEAADFLRDKNTFLEHEVEKRTNEIQAIQEVTILSLASLSEARDNETGNHLYRTQMYIRLLARKLGAHAHYQKLLTENTINLLHKSAPLHDIGKVGIPDRILLKPGWLDPDEVAVMKTHVTIGRDAIVRAEQHLGKSVDFLRMAKDIILYHHEKWNGTGYPEGLKGEHIPLSARLMALADVYDALCSDRPYRPALPHDEVQQMIINERGAHFDPEIVDAFMETQEEFRAITLHYRDGIHRLK